MTVPAEDKLLEVQGVTPYYYYAHLGHPLTDASKRGLNLLAIDNETERL